MENKNKKIIRQAVSDMNKVLLSEYGNISTDGHFILRRVTESLHNLVKEANKKQEVKLLPLKEVEENIETFRQRYKSKLKLIVMCGKDSGVTTRKLSCATVENLSFKMIKKIFEGDDDVIFIANRAYAKIHCEGI